MQGIASVITGDKFLSWVQEKSIEPACTHGHRYELKKQVLQLFDEQWIAFSTAHGIPDLEATSDFSSEPMPNERLLSDVCRRPAKFSTLPGFADRG